MKTRYLTIIASVFLTLPACGTRDAAAPAKNQAADGPGGETDDGGPGPVAPLCLDPTPFDGGDALWAKAPFEPPVKGTPGGDDSNDDGWDDGAGEGVGFIEDPDGGGISYECDVWAQDCPVGEKCMPWSNDGGRSWNATRCSPVDRTPGVFGDSCTVEGSPFSGIDDCELGVVCWDVDARTNEGACVEMCGGDEAMPVCPFGTWCYVGYNGSVTLCLDEALCEADGACRCMCPEGEDPDCDPDQCAPEPEPVVDDTTTEPPPIREGEESACPDTFDPVVMYMSNDDSNSQASPILARQRILAGRTVPLHELRMHEFMNYYEFPGASPTDDHAARVSMQMRRTDPDIGEFTLVVNAQAKTMTPAMRPPMNIVFSLDTSGSMSGTPIELLKDTMAATAGGLRAGDIISVVTWSSEQTVVLDGYVVAGPDDPELLGVIGNIVSGGSTDLHSGLLKAYQLANAHQITGGINRVVLVSDGGANTGVTDIDLIASEAKDEDDEGIYMVGVGVGTADSYQDGLMDQVTDAGKGAYVYIDSTAEAEKQFGDRFLANMAVAARDVRMKLTLPWYFGIKAFHGEEYSGDPTEVEPQHLAPNDSMTFHQIIAACDPSLITTCDEITARVDYYDPLTGAMEFHAFSAPIVDLVEGKTDLLRKGDVVVGYAKALIVIAQLANANEYALAFGVASKMQEWAETAAQEQSDPELDEIAALMKQYANVLQGLAG